MSQDDYNEYTEGFEAGEEAAKETVLSGEAAQKRDDKWMGRYEAESDLWWRGFHDGEKGHWDPPSVEEEKEAEQDEAEEQEAVEERVEGEDWDVENEG